MLVTVSTVHEDPATLARWVKHNVAMGADHMVVFLDHPDAPAQSGAWEVLSAHPQVTPVRADAAWWGTDRPSNLNVRQAIHANVAAQVLAKTSEVEWIFHIDGDEVVAIDPDALAAVPADRPAVLLEVVEAVTHYDAREWGTRFKRVPDEDQLVLLHTLGVIPRPSMGALIHGHALGKGGIRPGSDARLNIHGPMSGHRQFEVESFRDPRLRVLHHYSSSGAEMLAKAQRYEMAGQVTMGKPKLKLLKSIRALESLDLSPEARDRWQRKLFDAVLGDRIEDLEALDMIVHVDAERGTHQTVGLSAHARRVLHEGLTDLIGTDKSEFSPWDPTFTHPEAVTLSPTSEESHENGRGVRVVEAFSDRPAAEVTRVVEGEPAKRRSPAGRTSGIFRRRFTSSEIE